MYVYPCLNVLYIREIMFQQFLYQIAIEWRLGLYAFCTFWLFSFITYTLHYSYKMDFQLIYHHSFIQVFYIICQSLNLSNMSINQHKINLMN